MTLDVPKTTAEAMPTLSVGHQRGRITALEIGVFGALAHLWMNVLAP